MIIGKQEGTVHRFFLISFICGNLLLVYAARWFWGYQNLAQFALFAITVLAPLVLVMTGTISLVKQWHSIQVLWVNIVYWLVITMGEMAEDITQLHLHRPFPFIMSILSLFCAGFLLFHLRRRACQSPTPDRTTA